MMPPDPHGAGLLPTLSEDVLRELEEAGEVLDLNDGDALFREGDCDYPFYAVLSGKVRMTKQFGNEQRLLAVHERGHFVGEMSMLTGGPALASAHAQGPARVTRICIDDLRRLVAEDSPLAQTLLAAMAGRSQDVEAQTRQQEKLSALGKMAAALTHELNNPAAAAQRTGQALRAAVSDLHRDAMRYDCRFTDTERESVLALAGSLSERPVAVVQLDPLERSDREEEMTAWLDLHGVSDGWALSSTLISGGATLDDLERLAGEFRPETLSIALHWLRGSLQVKELATDLEASVSRISELVRSFKDYSYMDQASFQEIDIHEGIESTLRIFEPRLKGEIEVVRDYDLGAPRICAYAGELNQVWTNLIDNAIDAMAGKGTLTVRTERKNDGVLVEIGDTGHGVAPEIQERIFEPFFTTKGVGEGTGLGLDICYRIVSKRHGGSIRLASKPGDTRFQVWLPIEPPKEKA
jgi:Signal transduction histidine kinase